MLARATLVRHGLDVDVVDNGAAAIDADRTACRDAGMDAFPPKPWTKAELSEALDHLVRRATPLNVR